MNLDNFPLSSKIKIKNFNKNYYKKYNQKFDEIYFDLIKKRNDSRNIISLFNKNYKLNFKTNQLKKFHKFKTFALIGMGGSVLGSKAIYNFLEKKIKKKFYFFDDINEKKLKDFKKKEDLKKTLFLIISKSGNTIETLSNTFSLKILNKRAKNIIIISERSNNYLFNIAKKLKIFYIEHKKFVGGRFSVLSEVGILPAFFMGIDTIKLRSKILNILKGKNKALLKDCAIKLSYLFNSKKKNNLIFLNYSPQLEQFLFWCQQLIAESLGKKQKGFLPVISNAPKDHHSLLQLYLDGPKDKLFYIFSCDENSKEKINVKKVSNTKNYLHNKSLSLIKNAQKDALIKSLNKKEIPYREFNIKKINEQILGKLFAYFMLETIILGKLSKINPFNQPAVEEVKVYTKNFLN